MPFELFLATIWVILLALFDVPAQMIGMWFVRKTTPRTGRRGVIQNVLGVILCFIGVILVVMIGAIVEFFGRFGLLSPALENRYNNDPVGFSFIYVSLFVFVPAFVALLMGYFRARKRAFAATREGVAQGEWLGDFRPGQHTFQEFIRLNKRQTFLRLAVDWPAAILAWSITFFYFGDERLGFTVTLACLLAVHIVRMPKLVRQPNLDLSFGYAVGTLMIGVGALSFAMFFGFNFVRSRFHPELDYVNVAISLLLIPQSLAFIDYAIILFFRRFRRRRT